MSTDDVDLEIQLIANAVAADEARAWSRPSLTQRIRAWFQNTYGNQLAQLRHACEEDARRLGAVSIVWKDERGGEVIWRSDV